FSTRGQNRLVLGGSLHWIFQMAKIVNLFKLCEYIRSLSFYFLNSMSKRILITLIIPLFILK
ncbi:hypothetical protein DXC80_16420, partial [Bacteroides uniformis]